jgi:methyl-galactoside transport system substrate-binding protein
MKKRVAVSLLAAGILLAASQESYALFGWGKKKKSKKPLVGVTIYKYDDNFMAGVRKEIENAAAEDLVTLNMNDSQNDQSKQLEQIDVLLSKGAKALAINLVDPAAAGTVIAKAKKDNVPVVFFNKEPSQEAMQSYDKTLYVGTESKESGIIQVEMMARHWKAHPEWDLNGDGVVQFVYLKGEPGHPDAEARYEYSIKTMNEKGLKTEQLYMDTGMWDAAIAKDKMDAWLSGKNADAIEMVICGNDGMALGALEAMKAAGKSSLPLYGVDALAEVVTKVENGEIAGTVLNDSKNQGIATYETARNYALGKDPLEGTQWKLDSTKAVRVPYVGVDKDNVADFK